VAKCEPGCACKKHNGISCAEGCTCSRHRGKSYSGWNYTAGHRKVRRARGAPSKHFCNNCGSQTGKRAEEWATVKGTRGVTPNDFLPFCIECHRKYDDNPITTGRAIQERWFRTPAAKRKNSAEQRAKNSAAQLKRWASYTRDQRKTFSDNVKNGLASSQKRKEYDARRRHPLTKTWQNVFGSGPYECAVCCTEIIEISTRSKSSGVVYKKDRRDDNETIENLDVVHWSCFARRSVIKKFGHAVDKATRDKISLTLTKRMADPEERAKFARNRNEQVWCNECQNSWSKANWPRHIRKYHEGGKW
jgi:hypothetical protein